MEKKRSKKALIWATALLIGIGSGYFVVTKYNINPKYKVGEVIDTYNGVHVYYNGGFGHVKGRNTTADGYNLGLEYQCVEFVKRYYYEYFKHKMPDSYGHAKSFYGVNIASGTMNTSRGLLQFSNKTETKPQESDLLIYAPSLWNRFGHVAIISRVDENQVEIIQQNPGPFGSSREVYPLVQDAQQKWHIKNSRVLGFLRMPEPSS